MAALHVARQAIADAGWTADDLRDAALVVGTSRGNAAGWLGPWPGRRPFRLMAASNTIHSEPASAISIEFQITGPNHVLASGCSAGLDAIGIAMMLVRCGVAPRALAVAVDLPLVPLLLDNYAASGILSDHLSADPYRPGTSGFIPAEGAAAMAIDSNSGKHPRLAALWLQLGCLRSGGHPQRWRAHAGFVPTRSWIPRSGRSRCVRMPPAPPCRPRPIPPPWPGRFRMPKPSLHLLKPFLGHTIGASGMLESVILACFPAGWRPAAELPGLHAPPGFEVPGHALAATGPVAKLSHGMGGHNALLVLTPP